MGQVQPENPVISVVVPIHNEEERLEQNLRSLLSQNDAPAFEIIYLDNASIDRSWDRIVELSTDKSNVRRYRLNRRFSIGFVRRVGVQLSRGSVIANIDSDCIAPPEWLSKYVLLQDDIAVVGFPVFPPNDLEYLHWRFHYTGKGQYPPDSLPHGCGALIRKESLLRAGNFPDTELGEDTALFSAIRRMGGGLLLADSPAVRLLPKRQTLASHLGRYRRIGRGAGGEARGRYAMVLASLVFAVVFAAGMWSSYPWISTTLILGALLTLTNPWRVRKYVRSFASPRNLIARVACFSAIKFLETLSILFGYLESFGLTIRSPAKAQYATPVEIEDSRSSKQ